MKRINTYAYTWTKGVHNFTRYRKRLSEQPWLQGVILLSCVVIAMLLANLSATKEIYHRILETSLAFSIGVPGHDVMNFPSGMTVEKFINDVLMAVFFFMVGLEIRREIIFGELSSPKKAMMPVIAAAGGVLVPALIFTLVNRGTASATGWGIPTATDIAFVVGILSILGDRVPVSLKVFLTALAIADDLFAILVVALFYGGAVNMSMLGVALAVIAVVLIFNRLGEKRESFFILFALVIWALFYYSGIHATMSGVVMAFLVPMKPRYNRAYYMRKRLQYDRRIVDYSDPVPTEYPNSGQRHCLRRISVISTGAMGMSSRMEHALGPWVNYVIMPIFALANAGVEIPDTSYFNVFHVDPVLGSVGMGVFLGLLLGKPLGITLASFIAVKLHVGEKPSGASWKMLAAVACLGGIGFTMSIFVDTLSFSDQIPEIMNRLRGMGKVSVLMGSLCSGILGAALITLVHKTSEK